MQGRDRGIRLAGIIFAGLIAATALPSTAYASLETDILDRWYTLLGTANADGLGRLLAPRARIKLDDLGLTQTKQEFLDSMEEWRDAIAGGSVRFRVQSTAAGSATALVCYHFKSNDMLTKENFRIVGGLITQSDQTKVADDCGTFDN